MFNNPHFARDEVVLGHMKCVETVSLGNCARSTPRTLKPLRASSIASGAPAHRVTGAVDPTRTSELLPSRFGRSLFREPLPDGFCHGGRRRRNGEGQPGAPARCAVGGIEIAVSSQAQKALHVSHWEDITDLRTDPDQMTNVADDPKFAETRTALSAQLMGILTAAGDPRITGDGQTFERSPFTDAEPAATGKKKGR